LVHLVGWRSTTLSFHSRKKITIQVDRSTFIDQIDIELVSDVVFEWI